MELVMSVKLQVCCCEIAATLVTRGGSSPMHCFIQAFLQSTIVEDHWIQNRLACIDYFILEYLSLNSLHRHGWRQCR